MPSIQVAWAAVVSFGVVAIMLVGVAMLVDTIVRRVATWVLTERRFAATDDMEPAMISSVVGTTSLQSD